VEPSSREKKKSEREGVEKSMRSRARKNLTLSGEKKGSTGCGKGRMSSGEGRVGRRSHW